MKKFYFLLVSVVVSNAMLAQHTAVHKALPKSSPNEIMKEADSAPATTAKTASSQKAPFDVIWSEDFGTTATGSVPTGWTQAGVNQIWRKTFHGGTGYFSSPTVTIASSSATNGSLIFDADSLNKFVTADPTGAAYGPLSGSITTSTIDLTGKPNVRLVYSQLFRLCCSPTATFLTVSVSADGGTTWTDFDSKGTTAINSYSPNPENISINISAIAGGSSNVKVKFNFDSSLGVYFWQLDDIAIIEGPANDVKLERSYVDFSYTDGGYYTQTPVSEVAPLEFRGAVLNDGGVAQTNVTMNLDVSMGASVFNQNSNVLTTMPIHERDTLLVTPGYTPVAQGTYTATFTVNQTETDELISNNSKTMTWKVSDSTYARDGNVTTAAAANSLSPSQYVGGDVDGSQVGALYEFPAATNINSASAFVATATQNGASFDFVLYDANSATFTEVASSDIYTVTSNSFKNKWVTMNFVNGGPWPVTAGQSYMVAVRVYGAPATDLIILNDIALESVQPSSTCFVYPAGAATPAWGWIQKAPFLRLNVDHTVGINEHDAQNGLTVDQNMPNPFSENTLVNFEIAKANTISLSVYDVTGKLIRTMNEGTLPSGYHTITIDGSTLDAGSYFYTLSAGDSKVTKKMTIIKK